MAKTDAAPPPSPALEALARPFFKMAREMFLKDGTHVPVALLFQGGQLLGPIGLKFGNQMEKDAASRALATTVEKVGADAILVLNEAWVGKLVADSPIVPPSAQPDRQEVLALIAENRQGESLYISARIIRSGAKVTLGEDIVMSGQTDGFFAPLRTRWRGLPS